MFRKNKNLFQVLHEILRAKAIKRNPPILDTKKQLFETFTEEEFKIAISHLLHTISWVERLTKNHDFTALNQSRVLRTSNPTFKDKPLHVDIDNFISIDYDHDFYDSEDYLFVFNQVIPLRKNNDFTPINLLEKGRIVGFDIGITTHDGAPEAQSYGFVDVYDIPPIDTWFFVKTNSYRSGGFCSSLGLLFCWIPKAAEGLIQDTMDVEVYDSYFWLDEAFPNIQQEFERRIQEMMMN